MFFFIKQKPGTATAALLLFSTVAGYALFTLASQSLPPSEAYELRRHNEFERLVVRNHITYVGAGDSITVGTGASGHRRGYFNWTASVEGWAPDNVAQNGDSISDQLTRILDIEVPKESYSSLLIGQNESSFIADAGSPNWSQYYRAVMAATLWLSMPSFATSDNRPRIVGQDEAILKTGKWTAVREYGGRIGVRSKTSGDTLTARVHGRAAYVVQLTRDNSRCIIGIAIDGQPQGHFLLSKTYDAGNGKLKYIAEAIRLNGLNNTQSHTLLLTDISPGPEGCEILWIAGSNGDFAATGPHHFLLTPYHTRQSQPYSWAKSMSSAVVRIGDELKADGLDVNVADTASAVDMEKTPSLSEDGIHPNDAGHAILAAVLLKEINNNLSEHSKAPLTFAHASAPEPRSQTAAGTGTPGMDEAQNSLEYLTAGSRQPEQIFRLVVISLGIGCLALVFGRKHAWVSDVICGLVLPLILVGTAAGILSARWHPKLDDIFFLGGVSSLFADRWMLLAALMGAGSVMLSLGAWIIRDATERRISYVLVVPCVLFTFLIPPVGIIIYSVSRLTAASPRD